MKPIFLATAAAVGVLMTSQAEALTITNNDPVKQTITIVEGDKASNLSLAPGESGEQLCQSGCVIRMKNGDEYDFEGVEVVVIEGEVLYLEEVPQGDAASQNPDAGKSQ
jgi:hypothetical protein